MTEVRAHKLKVCVYKLSRGLKETTLSYGAGNNACYFVLVVAFMDANRLQLNQTPRHLTSLNLISLDD